MSWNCSLYSFWVVLFPDSCNCLMYMPRSAEDRQVLCSFLELSWCSSLLCPLNSGHLSPFLFPIPPPLFKDSGLRLIPCFLCCDPEIFFRQLTEAILEITSFVPPPLGHTILCCYISNDWKLVFHIFHPVFSLFPLVRDKFHLSSYQKTIF